MNSKHACILGVGFCILLSSSVFADIHSKLIKQKADQTNQALVRGDYATVAALTHPKLVQLMGGREKMISTMKSTLSEMKAHGVQFKSATIDNPTDAVSKNG